MSVSTQSGREAARAHRQGQKTGKKASSQPTRPTANIAPEPAPVATAVAAPEAPAKSPVRRPVPAASAPVAVAGGREAAKQMRQKQKSGKVSQKQATPNPHPKAKAKMSDDEPLVQPREKSASETAPKRSSDRRVNVKSEPVQSSGGRNASKAYRKAGAKGKAAQSAFKSKGTQSGSVAKMANPDASTRDIAKQIRADRCTNGKSGCTPTKSSGAIRRQAKEQRNDVPSKVGESSTLSGQSVTGTHVGQGRKVMTGAETGACQLVSGTEYLGTEEFAGSCESTPSAKPAKITQTQTTRGQTVSGTEVGNSKSVTGDQAGQCSAITGTEYIPADQSQLFCGTDAPAKSAQKAFSVMSQPSQEGKTSKVTGGEHYKSQSTTIRPSGAPQKVVASATAMGAMTTGTQVGRQQDVTGTEAGFCKSVTGTGYQSAEEASACQVEPTATAKKVTTSATTAGQRVTGDRSGGNSDMTGAESGSCQAVTGTGYMGAEQAASCSAEQQSTIALRQRQGINHAVSGVQPGPVGLTGAQKGACELVTGTHYQGVDQTALVCDASSAAVPGQSDFPQMIGQQPATNVAAAPVAQPEQGITITGDGWDRGTKVTGTEGPWAAKRNASIRGVAGQAPMGANQYRPGTMAEVPQSPITGSSGNTDTGAKVTLSGGARA